MHCVEDDWAPGADGRRAGGREREADRGLPSPDYAEGVGGGGGGASPRTDAGLTIQRCAEEARGE